MLSIFKLTNNRQREIQRVSMLKTKMKLERNTTKDSQLENYYSQRPITHLYCAQKTATIVPNIISALNNQPSLTFALKDQSWMVIHLQFL